MNREPLSADPRQVDAALRAQMSDISAAAQMLQRRAADEERNYLALIARATLRMARILDNRALARRLEDEDELRAVMATVDLVALCRKVVGRAGELLADLGLTVTFESGLAELSTLADEGLLEQLLYALLSNAAKAAQDGGRVAVILSKTDRSAVLTVGDEGAGLSEQALERLFQEGEHPSLDPLAGAGFGLRLARAIAEVHGGLVMLETSPGAGVRAAACLPLREGRRTRLESPRMAEDGFDRALAALSDVLPPESFLNQG